MFRLAYAVKGQVDGESFVARFIKSRDALDYLTGLKRDLKQEGCRVRGRIEKEFIEVSNLVEV